MLGPARAPLAVRCIIVATIGSMAPVSRGGATLSAQQPAAVVLDVRGDWRITRAAGATLAIGDHLRVSDTVVPGARPESTGYLTLLLAGGELLATRCSASAAGLPSCPSVPIAAPRPAGNRLARILSAITERFGRRPDRYVSLVTRSPTTIALSDGVLAIRTHTVDLSTTLVQAPVGAYQACLLPVPASQPPEPAECTSWSALRWEGSGPAPLAVDSANTGLQELRLRGPQGRTGTAWVVLLPPPRSDAALLRFDELRTVLDARVEGGLSAPARRALLRVHLDIVASAAR